MKRLFSLPLILACAAFCPAQDMLPTTGGEDAPAEQEKAPAVPQWVIELSNLSEADRTEYLRNFQAAKVAYATNRPILCTTHLNTCEAYFDGNPNVWLLRAGVCILQKKYDDAEKFIAEAETVDTDNDVIRVTRSCLQLAKGEYRKALENTEAVLYNMEYTDDTLAMRHSLMYRKFLCLLMMDDVDGARKTVADVSPLDDSPLYYYSQAALHMLAGDPSAATCDLNTADAIFARDTNLTGYKQNLILSGLREKVSRSAEISRRHETAR